MYVAATRKSSQLYIYITYGSLGNLHLLSLQHFYKDSVTLFVEESKVTIFITASLLQLLNT